ncbi:MAG TPA: glycerol-3-phosphate dehydrogenase [Pyrinomonadaceae bacterium]|nr:glycerol-3-phosphate dehydrogenase [Pyrinomonadaceae bacterium]
MPPRVSPEIATKDFDLIVIGAGINGAGIARDASMRGLNVLLLDKGDIGGGTTSWSTRLIHGGLRYLEHGEVRLVRESLRERETLQRIAPHLIRPLKFLLPCYHNSRRGWWTIHAGLAAYDLLCLDKSLSRHEMLSPDITLARAPGLNPTGLLGAAFYHDMQVEFPERLTLENVLAAKELGATIITYARVRRLLIENGKVVGVEFTDELEEGIYSVHGEIVVNASGPWVDQLLANAPQLSDRLIGGTKGSHLVVAPFPGAPPDALYVEARSDNRPFFIIPWNGNYLIGTTDIRYEGDLDHVEIDEEEIDFLLNETNQVIPKAKLTRDSILYTYSGVRPLAYTKATDEQRITRRHFIRKHPDLDGLISIVGGKLTTYRSLAEQTVDLILRLQKRPVRRCRTGEIPLPGAQVKNFPAYAREFVKKGSLPESILERLLRIYGTRTPEVVKLACEDPELGETFSSGTGAIAAEVVFAFKHELAQTLMDCLLRRTMVGLSASAGIGEDEAAARICQRHLGWSQSRAAEEVIAYRDFIKRFHPTKYDTACDT